MQPQECLACGWEIKDGGIKVKADGYEITVCYEECAEKAKADPAKYANKYTDSAAQGISINVRA